MVTPAPMSDRRTILTVIAMLVALLGLVVTVTATIWLREPFTISGELGTRIDITRELIAAVVTGVLLVVGGIGVAARLVRAQLRAARL